MSDSQKLTTEGLQALAQGRLEEALAAFQSLVEHDPKSDVGWMGLSMVHERRRDFDAAIDAIRRAIALKPDEPLHYTNLSRFYQSKGMIPEAEAAMAESYRLRGA